MNDATATQSPPADQDEDVDLPVFRGFDTADLTGKDLAEILGVSPPTVSKWRHGKARMPASKLAFMTLLLASRAEDLERSLRESIAIAPDAPPADPLAVRRANLGQAIDSLRQCLHLQEAINTALPAESVREGSRQFRQWWEAGHRTRRRVDVA